MVDYPLAIEADRQHLGGQLQAILQGACQW
jgi:hypothetical protein